MGNYMAAKYQRVAKKKTFAMLYKNKTNICKYF